MNVHHQIPPWVYVLLGWGGGIIATVIGAWVTSKIRVYEDSRKAHLEDIKERVLKPLHAGLRGNFAKAILGFEPVVFVAQGQMRTPGDVGVTEQQARIDEALVPGFPGFAPTKSLDTVLLRDARRNHFRKLLNQFEHFMSEYDRYVSECHSWCKEIADTILTQSGLPPFPAVRSFVVPNFYVMHNRLAIFVFKRIHGMTAPALRIEAVSSHWGLHDETATLAFGEDLRIERLRQGLDMLISSKAAQTQAEAQRQNLRKLQEGYNALISDLEYAIASRRLRKRCDLVPFF